MGRLSIVAGLVVGIVAAVLLLGAMVVLTPDDSAGPVPTPLAAATPGTSSTVSGGTSPLPSVVASDSPATSAGPGVSVTP